jgi:hypothetical protein
MLLTARATNRIKDFVQLETGLATLCIIAPALMIMGDNGNIRASISAYYDMTENVLYYVPLTVAFMLFIVNGVIKHKKFYNVILGISLAVLVILNYRHFPYIHLLAVAVFFIGNAVVMVKYTSKDELWFKSLLVAIIITSILAWSFGYISLFWAEWISLSIIGWHYILEAWDVIN